ncbi:hypothetical protein Ddye_019912 [Dipteronia dyeriana]|uniref:DUF4228 domain-containing protein n=1 Tax=Dipteronia dyeriana TaxID=168575 RepID=A0AAD9WW70_9ROSI|nr:hypothetical protein Ddye_019912 [Dipteronia dyeriana]
MTISSWLCTNSTKNMLIKIVHPGGHVELHDRPFSAAEIMLRNPRCIVAYPHVFQQPWAIVAPDTTLMLGQKYYVVPVTTIRKLQRLSFKNSPSPVNKNLSVQPQKNEESDDHVEKQGCFTDDNCSITCLNITGMKTKGNNYNNGEDSSNGTKSSSSSSETKGLTRNKKEKRSDKDCITKGSSKRLSTSIDNWQPNLESITEE